MKYFVITVLSFILLTATNVLSGVQSGMKLFWEGGMQIEGYYSLDGSTVLGCDSTLGCGGCGYIRILKEAPLNVKSLVSRGDIDDEYRQVESFHNSFNNGYRLVTSFKDLTENVSPNIQSGLLQAISKEDFDKYDYAVVLINLGGAQYLKNEKLKQQDGYLHFSYEVWREDGVNMGCIGHAIYVIKLKKY